ncbi:hypothetical protein C8J57DRAFT_1570241, partial [Mycena rebaudengoi]
WTSTPRRRSTRSSSTCTHTTTSSAPTTPCGACSSPRCSSSSASPGCSRSIYLIVIFVGLLVVLILGVMLSAWCCKGTFENSCCCPCYLCACCGGLGEPSRALPPPLLPLSLLFFLSSLSLLSPHCRSTCDCILRSCLTSCVRGVLRPLAI